MTDNLFPDDFLEDEELFDEEDEEDNYIEDDDQEDAAEYRYSVFFDFDKGDFIVRHDGKLKEATGIEAWEQWCQKIIQTQRYAHAAYSTDIGIDFGKAIQAESREEAENILNREITEALMADPSGRTQYVGNIEFDWQADGCDVTVPIQGIDGDIEIVALYSESEVG